MPKLKESKAKDWRELPLFLTLKDITEFLGINKQTVSEWFKSRDFPDTSSGKVEKNLFRKWYYKHHAKMSERELSELQIDEMTVDTVLATLLQNFEVKEK